MVRRNMILLAGALVVLLPRAFSQLITWEELDGPYRTDTRTHMRYADGDRRFFGGNSGTYRSADGGLSWTALSPAPMRNLRVYATGNSRHVGLTDTAVATAKPDHGIQQALYVSTDRGESWTLADVGSIGPLAFGGGDTVYKAAGRADAISGATSIARSTNGGITWTTLLTPYMTWGFNQLYTQPNNVFAHMDGSAVMSRTLRSTNGGTTWDTLDADQMMFHMPNNLLRVRRDITGTFSAYAFIELSTNNGATWSSKLTADSGFISLVTNGIRTLLVIRKPEHWVYRSTNAGSTWIRVAGGPAADRFVSIRYYGRSHAVAMTAGGAYYRTVNDGTSWEAIMDMDGTPLTGTAQPASDSLFVVADERGNWIESTDAGATWTSRSFPFAMPPVTSLLGVPSGSLFVGTMSGSHRKRGEEDWRSLGIPGPVWDMMYRSGPLFIAGNGRHGIFPLEFNGSIFGADTSVTPSGSAWSYGGGLRYFFNRNDYNSVHAISDNVLVAGWGNMMVRTTNHGSSWSPPITRGKRFVVIVADSAGNLWAGNDSTGVYRSTDQGVSWTASSTGLTDLHVLTMTVARNGYLLAGTPSGIYRSTDGGTNWAYAALSSRTIQSLETGSGSRAFAGTSNGFFLSTNSGANWSEFSLGIEDKDIRAVALTPGGEVYCGTAARGVFRMVEAGVGIPLLIRPAHKAMQVPRPVRLIWHMVEFANGYDILVSTSSLFPRTGTWDTTMTRGRDTTVSVPGLKGKTQYYWKVRARTNTGYGSYAKYRDFTTGLAPTGYEVVPISPRDGTTLTADSARCIWRSPDSKTTKYWLEYSVDSTFAKANRDSTIADTGYVIRLLTPGRTYFWRVKASTGIGWADFSDVFSFTSRLTDVCVSGEPPTAYALDQNYPNPFNPATVIRYQVPVAGPVRLAVFDILGREVAVLLDEHKQPGTYQVEFHGSQMASGAYICRLTAGKYTECRRMLLLK